jgi:hypothetical protein
MHEKKKIIYSDELIQLTDYELILKKSGLLQAEKQFRWEDIDEIFYARPKGEHRGNSRLLQDANRRKSIESAADESRQIFYIHLKNSWRRIGFTVADEVAFIRCLEKLHALEQNEVKLIQWDAHKVSISKDANSQYYWYAAIFLGFILPGLIAIWLLCLL